MSWLADRTGIHVNSINDVTSGRAVKQALRNPLVLGAASLAIPGVGGLVGKGLSALPGVSKVAGAVEAMGGDRFRGIGSFLSKHKNDILDYGQAAEDIYGKYRQSQAQDEAMKLAKQTYAENAPLRARGRELLLDESRPDLSAVFADPNNPQGRYRVVNVGSHV